MVVVMLELAEMWLISFFLGTENLAILYGLMCY